MPIPKVKTKKPRVAFNEALKYWGDEPQYPKDRELTDSERRLFYTWHNYVTGHADGVGYLYEYLKNSPERLESIRKVNPRRIISTYFWMARLVNLGYILPSHTIDVLEEGISLVSNRVSGPDDDDDEIDPETGEIVVKEKKKEEKPRPSRNKSDEILMQVEEDLVEGGGDPYSFFTNPDFPKRYLKDIVERYSNLSLELRSCLDNHDRVTKEYLSRKGLDAETKKLDKIAYAQDKTFLKERLEVLAQVLEDAERVSGNVKQARKPRKKKVPSAEKRVSLLKYQKEDPNNKLASIDPIKILGAKELWLFNTKYNLLYVYRSSTDEGLDLKGTTLKNWDDKRSLGKRIGRTVERYTKQVLESGKVGLRKVMDGIKGSAVQANGRINENVILLRAVN